MTSNIKFCPECGEGKISSGQKFCHNCGGKFIIQAISENKESGVKSTLPKPPPEILNLNGNKEKKSIDIKEKLTKLGIDLSNQSSVKEYSSEEKIEEPDNSKRVNFPKLSSRLESMKQRLLVIEKDEDKRGLSNEINFMECILEALSQPPAIIIRKDDDDIEDEVQELYENIMKHNKRFFDIEELELLKENIRSSLKKKKTSTAK